MFLAIQPPHHDHTSANDDIHRAVKKDAQEASLNISMCTVAGSITAKC